MFRKADIFFIFILTQYPLISIYVLITDPPNVYTMRQQNKIEGRDLSVTCRATPGNPNSTTFYWTKVDNPGFRQNGSTLQLPNIQRTSSGTYRCTAENNYSNGERGTDSQAMVVNVQCETLKQIYLFYPRCLGSYHTLSLLPGVREDRYRNAWCV